VQPAIQLQNGQHTPVVKSIILRIGSELPEFVIPNVVAALDREVTLEIQIEWDSYRTILDGQPVLEAMTEINGTGGRAHHCVA
jgi:hypothetical protein